MRESAISEMVVGSPEESKTALPADAETVKVALSRPPKNAEFRSITPKISPKGPKGKLFHKPTFGLVVFSQNLIFCGIVLRQAKSQS